MYVLTLCTYIVTMHRSYTFTFTYAVTFTFLFVQFFSCNNFEKKRTCANVIPCDEDVQKNYLKHTQSFGR